MNIRTLKHSVIRTVTLTRCLLALFVCAASQLSGADKPETRNIVVSKVAEPNVSAAWQRRIPEMVSDNLPLEEIIRLLRELFPELNFLINNQTGVDADIGSVSVKMVLRAVTLQEILKALELAAGRPIQITGGPDERLVVFGTKAVDAAGMPLRLPPVETRVFNISKYLDNRPDKEAAIAMKELENVLHTAGAMLSEATRGERRFNPQLNLHRSTRLLIAVGRPDELHVIEQVVKELQGSSPANKVSSSPERELKADPPRAETPAGRKP